MAERRTFLQHLFGDRGFLQGMKVHSFPVKVNDVWFQRFIHNQSLSSVAIQREGWLFLRFPSSELIHSFYFEGNDVSFWRFLHHETHHSIPFRMKVGHISRFLRLRVIPSIYFNVNDESFRRFLQLDSHHSIPFITKDGRFDITFDLKTHLRFTSKWMMSPFDVSVNLNSISRSPSKWRMATLRCFGPCFDIPSFYFNVNDV